MKLTAVLVFASAFQCVAVAMAQKINLNAKREPLKNVLSTIERQGGYTFFFRGAQIANIPISVQINHADLKDAMDAIAKEANLEWSISGKTIVIKRQEIKNDVSLPVVNQKQKRISGKVVNKKGENLSGVNVTLKGTKIGTSTDEMGEFSLEIVPGLGSILQFSFIGYNTLDIALSDKTQFNVTLEEQNSELSEVVVVGYGVQKRANLTGAVSTVKMDDVLGSRPISSTTKALQGAIPGLQITSGSGQPGTGASINIRGTTSINGGEPLVLVDNVPMSMDNINPMDIETVTVLKDAAASSIYGARAAFGVILITTKKGKRNQKNTFNFTSNLASTQARELPEKASPLQTVQALNDWGTTTFWTGQKTDKWLELIKEYNANPGAFPTGETSIDGTIYPLKQTHKFGEDFLEHGFEQMHNLSYSGGSEKSTYRVSLGYTDENGIMITDNDRYKRYNINTALSTELVKGLNSTVNFFYRNQNSTTPANIGDIYYRGGGIGSYAPLGWGTTPDGKNLPYAGPGNILRTQKPIRNFGDDLRIFGKLEYEILTDLKIIGEYTFNKTTTNQRSTTEQNRYIDASTRSEIMLNTLSNYSRQTGNTDYHALNLYMNYNKNVGDHTISGILGMNRESSKNEQFFVDRLDLINPQVPSISTSTGTIGGDDSFSEFAVEGYFGRINYSYKNRYLFEANGRFDGSSRFPSGSRFGFFPSFSAGWNVSEERFMQSLKPVLSGLKLRGSYGEIGNQAIGNYAHIPGMASSYSSWIDLKTNIRYLSLGAPNLVSSTFTWETVRTINGGIDLGLWNNKLNMSFDYFRRQTLDMLSPGLELPGILGTSAPLQNVADLESKGWEAELSWKDKRGDFHYSFGINVSDNRAYITKYNNPAGLLQFNDNGTLSNYYVGQQLGEIWGFRTQGFYSINDFVEGSLNDVLQRGTLKEGIAAYKGISQNPGDIRYEDLNGDGVIFTGNNTLADPGDRTIIGNTTRRYQFGVNGAMGYKSFDLSFFLQGVGKRDLFVSNEMFWPYTSNFETVYVHHLDYWTPDRVNAYFSRSYPDAGGNGGSNRRVQSKYLSDGSYLTIKNITLGYSVPAHLLKNIFVKNIRMFFSGENLYTFHHMPKGMDTEATSQSRGLIYPFLRKYSFGVNVNF
ncbi:MULTISPECIES: SusC/RagA family TonB-linked outer membrane protein [Sphingobacterium]|uniref:SusC/RagA family TonB-linked outer membrane protein n=1 Tax=Sphingobacterium TaxID=28453 RepID=UPI00257D0A29|nr:MULTISPECIES: SusC/RagA family TonB-linked outer membrane protein [Sphingobacterium]